MSQAVESGEITPVLSIRPHHVFDDLVRNVLLRKQTPEKAAFESVSSWHLTRKEGDEAGYWEDMLGNSKTKRRMVRERLTGFLERVQALEDNDFVRLDIEPDGICQSCTFGRHCTGTHFPISQGLVGLTEVEIKSLLKARLRLTMGGYEQGSDYINYPASRQVYDFEGRGVKEYESALLQTVTFEGLIVRAGPLRGIVKEP